MTDRITLILSGGNALGAYEAGAYEALHERGLQPARFVAVSTGAINAALIAGNPPEKADGLPAPFLGDGRAGHRGLAPRTGLLVDGFR
ncbi:patatin-like phospholipase family protein [Azotobacter vinelandii]